MNRYLCYFSEIMNKFPHFEEKAQKDRLNDWDEVQLWDVVTNKKMFLQK